MNHMLHIAAIVQLRNNTDGRAYYRRKLDAQPLFSGDEVEITFPLASRAYLRMPFGRKPVAPVDELAGSLRWRRIVFGHGGSAVWVLPHLPASRRTGRRKAASWRCPVWRLL